MIRRPTKLATAVAERGWSPSDPESPRTEVSDADPPEVAKLGYSPYSKQNADLYPSRAVPGPVDTSALDHLALLAENAYAELSANGAPAATASSSSNTTTAAADATMQDVSAPEVAATTDIKGKGVDRRTSDSFDAQGPPPAKRARHSMAPGAPSLESSTSALASSAVAPIPPYSGSTGSGKGSPVQQRQASPSTTMTTANEVSVKSKEDLKALMHVRKLLSSMEDEAGLSAEALAEKKALLTFIDGGAVVVS